MAYREDVVWRADTGAYHARGPILMPPMAGADASDGLAPSSVAPVLSWLASQEATNLLLLLILIVLIFRGD